MENLPIIKFIINLSNSIGIPLTILIIISLITSLITCAIMIGYFSIKFVRGIIECYKKNKSDKQSLKKSYYSSI